MSEISPCRMCGASVREVRRKGKMSPADASPPIEIVRTCTNPKCGSNTGDMSLADEV